ncbi:MAG: protein phosphatase CheZ [Sulfuritalea sp.]|nr:protein phosphatase CheZ [Sulfuritalea sp.]
MENSIKDDDGSDSDDLQALFDCIAGGMPAAASAVAPATAQSVPAGDSDELQALFDSVQAPQQAAGVAATPTIAAAAVDPQEAVFNGLGLLARQLHDSLRGLGVDKLLEDSARQIPDTRQRLAYIAQMTEQAASRVLNATDIAKPVQDELIARSQALSHRWEAMFASRLSVDEFKALAADSRAYFAETPGKLKLTNDQLLEIIMAQDFQDLTGQVIKKVVEMVQGLETQLLGLLLEAMPEQRKVEAPEGLLNGPVVNGEGRIDIVNNQSQVDDLLESLGF